MERRAFTVEEANALIPVLRAAFERIADEQRRVRVRYEKLQVLDVLWGEAVARAGNPDHDEYLEHRAAIRRAVRAIEELVEREIRGRGLRFPQGGLEYGLVDFPTVFEGRWVFLCWRVDEPGLAAWHEVDAGYRGRQPLTPEHARRMGKEEDPRDMDDSVLDS